MSAHLYSGLKRAGHRLHSEMFFDTLKINCGVAAKDIQERAVQRQINLRPYSEGVVSSFNHNFSLLLCLWAIPSVTDTKPAD